MTDSFMNMFLRLCLVATCTGGLAAQGKVFMEPSEALELAFPKCKFERKTHVLTAAAQADIRKRSGQKPPRSVMYVYEARKGKEIAGYVYFDRHRVRSKKELIMVAVDTKARASRVEVIAFEEPIDYMPRGIWYDQFKLIPLCNDLSVKTGAIKPVAGCTLTVHATVDTTRRILASHSHIYPSKGPVVKEPRGGKPEGEKKKPQVPGGGDKKSAAGGPAAPTGTR